MSAIATDRITAPVGGRSRLTWAIQDSLVVMVRNLMRFIRIPALFVFSIVQPLMFVLLFRFVFGPNIPTPGLNYVNFLMPGIFVQTINGAPATVWPFDMAQGKLVWPKPAPERQMENNPMPRRKGGFIRGFDLDFGAWPV